MEKAFKSEQKYRLTFTADPGLTPAQIELGRKEAAWQLHAIGEYPWKDLPVDIPVKDEDVALWKTGPNGYAERICHSFAHAIEVETCLGIVDHFSVEMEPID